MVTCVCVCVSVCVWSALSKCTAEEEACHGHACVCMCAGWLILRCWLLSTLPFALHAHEGLQQVVHWQGRGESSSACERKLRYSMRRHTGTASPTRFDTECVITKQLLAPELVDGCSPSPCGGGTSARSGSPLIAGNSMRSEVGLQNYWRSP